MAKIEIKDNELDWIIEDTFNSIAINDTLSKIGENGMTRRQFAQYLKENPEFEKRFRQAEFDACMFLENDMLNIHRGAKRDQAMARAMPIDHKLARVKLEAIRKVLEYRNPAKYSPKVDVNMNGTISLRGAISNANERLATQMRDVTIPGFNLPPELPPAKPSNMDQKKPKKKQPDKA